MVRCNVLTATAATVLGLAVFAGNATAQQKTMRDQLVGPWSLVAGERIEAGGTRKPVFGGTPKGMAIFDASGRYVAVIVDASRAKWKSPSRDSVTPEEWAAAAKETIAQFGTWSLDESTKTMTRRIELALNPNNAGAEAKLAVTVSGDELTLTNASSILTGGQTQEVYRRVK